MIILDAIIAGGLMYLFKIDDFMTGLFVTCMITFLRMSMKVSRFIDVIYQAAEDVYNLNKKEEEM